MRLIFARNRPMDRLNPGLSLSVMKSNIRFGRPVGSGELTMDTQNMAWICAFCESPSKRITRTTLCWRKRSAGNMTIVTARLYKRYLCFILYTFKPSWNFVCAHPPHDLDNLPMTCPNHVRISVRWHRVSCLVFVRHVVHLSARWLTLLR